MMQVVFIVLHKTELLQDLLTKLKKAGVSGGTIIDSQGMISYIQESDESYILGSLGTLSLRAVCSSSSRNGVFPLSRELI